MTTSTKVNSFTILKTKNQFILLCWKKKKKKKKKKNYGIFAPTFGSTSQWQTSQQAGPCSVPKFTSTSITVKHLLIKNKNINQSKSSLLIWHYVSYLFLFIDIFFLEINNNLHCYTKQEYHMRFCDLHFFRFFLKVHTKTCRVHALYRYLH